MDESDAEGVPAMAELERDIAARRRSAKDRAVSAVSFGVGAVICAVVAVSSGVWWLWLVAGFSAACAAVTGVIAARRHAAL